MQFTYVEDGLPIPNVMVLAAWTDGDEHRVIPSAWSGEHWYVWMLARDSRRLGSHVYAWTPWPETPEPSSHE